MSSYAVGNPQISYNLYGHDLLSQIYQNIYDTIAKNPGYYDLSRNPQIKEKLDQLKVLENEIYDTLKTEAIKEKLKEASHGYLDVDRIPASALPAILEKHSNLLGLTSTYNNRVANLVNELQQINNAIWTKVNINGQDYGVRMSIKPKYPGYPTYPTYPVYRTGLIY